VTKVVVRHELFERRKRIGDERGPDADVFGKFQHFGGVSDAVGLRHQRQRIGQVVNADCGAAQRQRMIVARQQHDWLRRAGAIFDARMQWRVVRQPDVRAAFGHFVEHIVNRQRFHADIDHRILRAERRDDFVDQRVDIAFAERDLHEPCCRPFNAWSWSSSFSWCER
jgi:hypothetical protein